jgi:predicted GTPase
MQKIDIKGESGLGKSTLIETLFNARLYPQQQPKEIDVNGSGADLLEFSVFTVDMEESGCEIVVLFSTWISIV